jgi:hypothetical protein
MMLQFPADTPVTNPDSFTVAIPGLELDQTPEPVNVEPEGNVLFTDRSDERRVGKECE